MFQPAASSTPSAAPPRLAIFDFDGTLVDSYGWFASVINDVALRHGFRPARDDEADMLRGMDARDVMRRLSIPLWKLPSIARDMRARKLAVAASLPLFDGTRAMLGDLHSRGLMLAVVSSDSEDSVRASLGPETAGLVSRFNCSASLFGKARKLEQVLRAARVSSAEAIYIGDEMRDAAAARKAGILFGAVTWGYAKPTALAICRPDMIFETVADIGRIVPGPRM